jgi:polyketide cyclase/dehydrase/lipid transport protein
VTRTWQGTARFEASATVDAPADRAWALLRSPEAWSLGGAARCVFEIPASEPDAGPDHRVWFCLSADAQGKVAGLPMEVTSTPPYQLDARMGGEHRTWRLSVEPTRRGTKLRIRGTARTRREQVVETEAQLRGGLGRWLDQMGAVLEGSRPWPGAGVPGPVRALALAVPQPQGALEVAVEVELDVPAALAGRLLRAPEVVAANQAAVQQLGVGVAWIGGPPGENPGETGALTCMVVRTTDGSLVGAASVCTESSATGYLVRQLRWPYDQVGRQVMASGTGSRLELRQRCLPRPEDLSPEEIQARVRRALTAMAGRLKVAIEELAAREGAL